MGIVVVVYCLIRRLSDWNNYDLLTGDQAEIFIKRLLLLFVRDQITNTIKANRKEPLPVWTEKKTGTENLSFFTRQNQSLRFQPLSELGLEESRNKSQDATPQYRQLTDPVLLHIVLRVLLKQIDNRRHAEIIGRNNKSAFYACQPIYLQQNRAIKHGKKLLRHRH